MITSRSDARLFGKEVDKSQVSDVVDKAMNNILGGKPKGKSGFADVSRHLKYLPMLNKTAQALILVSALMVVVVLLSMVAHNKVLNIISTLACLATLVAGVLCIVFGAMVPSTKSGIFGMVTGVVVLIVVGSCGVNVAKMF